MDAMTELTFIEFIRYNNWANSQIFALCEKLSPEQLATNAPGAAYGSIHATLGHLIAAEADYVGRLTGESPQPPFKWEDGPALADIAAFAVQADAALLDAARRIEPTYIVHEEEDGNTIDYQARILFLQAVIHGIEHRTNVATILGSLGVPVPELDGWGYLFSHTEEFEVKEGSL